jgi:nucleoside-diphosphate-sugar epimerase
MKIVITGALGHIGSKLIRDLPVIFPGSKIVMIDNLSSNRYCSLFNLPENGKYKFVEADVIETDLRPLFDGADVVIQLAAITDAAGSFEIKEKLEFVNFNSTLKVAEACCDIGCPMIHLSSTSVYGTQQEIVDEDCTPEELKPQSPYAETKLKEEELLKSMNASGALKHVTCRFGTIFGTSPGMRFHTAVNKFCWQAVTGQPITVWRTALNQKRPYLDIEDAVRAVAFILNRRIFDGRVYNVLTANNTVKDIVDMISGHVPAIAISYVDSRIMNQLSYTVSNKRFTDMGFEFRGSLERGIADTMTLLGYLLDNK